MIDHCPGMQELPDARHILPRNIENHVEELIHTKRLPDKRAYGYIAGFFLGIADRNCFGQRHRGRIRGENPKSRDRSQAWETSELKVRQPAASNFYLPICCEFAALASELCGLNCRL